MTEQEKKFVASIQNKIIKYNIPTDLKEAFKHSSGIIMNTTYADKTYEVVDTGIESFLMTKSFAYWLDNYTMCDIPNKGTVQFRPYFYQLEMAKEIDKYRKIVIDKTRQCLTANNFVMTDRGYISIADVKVGDKIETIQNGEIIYTDVLNFIPQGKKRVCRVLTSSGLAIEGTLDHKVLTKDGWKEIQDLTVNDEVICKANNISSVDKIICIEVFEGEQDVYDITTRTHDFLANGIVVHNCGMSTVFSLYCFWRLQVYPSDCISVISLTQLKAQDFIHKYKTTMDIQPLFFLKKCIENNKQKMRFEHPNGEVSSITSESMSENAGRSSSLSFLVLDEVAFYKSARMVQSILAASVPTLTKTGGTVCLISTPNGGTSEGQPGSYYYNQVQEAKMEMDPNTKYLRVEWWQIPDDPQIPGPKKGYNKQLEQAIQEDYYHNSEVRNKWKKYFSEIEKNPNSNPFLKSQLSTLGEFKFRQEILGEFIISGDRVLTPDNMNKIKLRLKEPIMKDYLCLNGNPVKEMRNFWIWKHPEASKKYIVSLDPSQGTSQDRACIQVLDIDDMEQVAEFYGFAATTQLPNMVKDIARVYNDAYVVIEANSIGDGVFNSLYYNQIDPYGNVFKQKKTNNGITRFTGWITDVKTRKLMTTEVFDWLSNAEMFDKFHMYSERVYTELETWIVDSKGKFIHASNCHDDSIMALALALYNRNKAVQASSGAAGFVDEDGNVVNYDRKDYEKKLYEQKQINGKVFDAGKHENELSSILDDGRKKLNLNDTNYAGMYSNQEDFSAGGDYGMNRTIKERLGTDIDTYNWLLS